MSVRLTVEEIIFTRRMRRQGRKRVSRKFHQKPFVLVVNETDGMETRSRPKRAPPHVTKKNRKSNKMMELCDSVSAEFHLNKLQVASPYQTENETDGKMKSQWNVHNWILIDFSSASICISTGWCCRRGMGNRWAQIIDSQQSK